MNAIWQEFLSKHASAQATDDTNIPENSGMEKNTGLSDLSWRSQIEISGADAKDFLHGQFSNDLMALDGSNTQLSSYSTPKGRVLALFRISKLGERYLLDCPADVAQAFVKRLSMFVMRSDVSIKLMDSERVSIGVFGETAAELLERHGAGAPETNHIRVSEADIVVTAVPAATPHFVVSGPVEAMQTLWLSLQSDGASVQTADDWKLGLLQAGQPEVYSDTSESFVAQMLNLQLVDGVNFKKGCYPGQEVIARLQYLGSLKRQMFLFETEAEQTLSPGDAVMAEGSEEPAGEIVDTAKQGGRTVLLAVMKVAVLESAASLTAGDGAILQALDMPYTMTADD